MLNLTAAGRLGRDAETKSVGDSTVTKFSIAVDVYANKEKVTQWIDCDFWGARGERLAQYLTKGSNVTATGEALLRDYQARDGSMKSALSLRVSNITLQGGKNDGGQSHAAPAQPQRPQTQTQTPGQRERQASMAVQAPDDFGDDIPFSQEAA